MAHVLWQRLLHPRPVSLLLLLLLRSLGRLSCPLTGDVWLLCRSAQREADASTPSLITAISPWQRKALGIPLPGEGYWTAETVELLEQRYPQLDSAPYRAQMQAPRL